MSLRCSHMARRGRRANKTGRSDGEEQFLKIDYPMARSAAWRSLGGASLKVWVELHTRFHGGNNGKLNLSLDEAASVLGLGKATVDRALKELISKGFVIRTRKGQWYGRKASLFALTNKSLEGLPPTNEWRRWTPKPGETKRRRFPILMELTEEKVA